MQKSTDHLQHELDVLKQLEHEREVSERLYAKKIVEKADWGFTDENIFSRETIQKYCIRIQAMYGVDKIVSPHPYAHCDNLLIDNLMACWNDEKTTLMGIKQNNYCKVEDYFGDDSDNDIFFDTVKHFIKEKAKT
jgi:predicted AAA+ superfamily ATPase